MQMEKQSAQPWLRWCRGRRKVSAAKMTADWSHRKKKVTLALLRHTVTQDSRHGHWTGDLPQSCR